MSTPSTGAPQPPDTGKDEDLPDPVEAVESAVYKPVQGEGAGDDQEGAATYRPAETEDPDGVG